MNSEDESAAGVTLARIEATGRISGEDAATLVTAIDGHKSIVIGGAAGSRKVEPVQALINEARSRGSECRVAIVSSPQT